MAVRDEPIRRSDQQQVTHLDSSAVQPFFLVSAHLHAGEKLTDGRKSQTLLDRKQEVQFTRLDGTGF